MNVGLAIKTFREKQTPKINQGVFAKTIGISQTYLSLIESSKKVPNFDVLEKISKEFKVPLPVLFWYGIELKDIQPHKVSFFMQIKPVIDSLMVSIT